MISEKRRKLGVNTLPPHNFEHKTVVGASSIIPVQFYTDIIQYDVVIRQIIIEVIF